MCRYLALLPNVFDTRLSLQDRVKTNTMAKNTETSLHREHDSSSHREHDTSWSANLEHPRHAEDRELLVTEALDAVSKTAPGRYVNLVTHTDHGHPSEYLYSALESEFDEIEFEYVDKCGCGGHVTRVFVHE